MNKTKDGSLESLLGIQLSMTLLGMKRLLVKEFEAGGIKLSFEEWMNFLPLMNETSLTQNDLAKILGKDKTTISRSITNWEKRGLITRKPSPSDQRAVNLVLTKKALQYHHQARPIVMNADKVFKLGLTDEDLEMVFGVLSKIRYSVSEYSKK